MNFMNRIRAIIIIILASSVMTSCQLFGQEAIKSAEQFTITGNEPGHQAQTLSAATNSQNSLSTQTPTPDAAAPAIDLDISDLPAGFLKVPDEITGFTTEQISGKTFSNHNPFLFYNGINDQLVIGFTTHLDSESDINEFSALIEKPERAISIFAKNFRATSILNEPDINILNLADISAANKKITLNIANTPNSKLSYLTTLVVFQTNDIGVFIVEMFEKNQYGRSIFPDYGTKFFNKIDALTTISKLTISDEPSTQENKNWMDPGPWLLSDNYETIQFEEIGITQEEKDTIGFEADFNFAYKNLDNTQVVIGFVKLLESYEEIGLFDVQIDLENRNKQNSALSTILINLATAIDMEILEENLSYNTEENGHTNVFDSADSADGRTIIAKLNGQTYQLEETVFRKENYGFLVFSYQATETLKKNELLSNQYLSGRLNLTLSATQPFRVDPSIQEYKGLSELVPNIPQKNPSIGKIEIPFQELLPDYIQTPPNLLNLTTELASGQSFSKATLFHLAGNNITLIGFTTPLENIDDITNFNTILSGPESSLTNILDFYNASSYTVEKTRKAFATLGEDQKYISINLFTPNDVKGRKVEMVAFQNNNTGYYFVITYSAFYAGASIFPDFPNKLVHKMDEQSENATATPSPLNLYTTPESKNPLVAWIEPGKEYIVKGFDRVTLEEILITKEEWAEIGLEYDTLFIYKNPNGPQIILGYNVLLNTYQDIGKFEIDLTKLDPLLIKLASAVGATSLELQKSKEIDLFSVSECNKWRSLTGFLSGVLYRFQIVKTREENVGFMIFSVEPASNKDDLNTDYDFISNACNATISPLFITRGFRISFPVYKAEEILGAPPTP
ncbi:MAG: hypothetical protein QGD96_08405 [Anaerolineae bacterium]|nr:hypothetical protein [Anaerolineae bacterium]